MSELRERGGAVSTALWERFAVMAFVSVLSLTEIFAVARASTSPVPSLTVVEGMAQLVGWMVIVPGTMSALDRLPFRAGVRARNLGLTVVVGVLAGVIQGAITIGLIALGHLGLPEIVTESVGLDAISESITRAIGQVPMFLLVPHLGLRWLRAARTRQRDEWERDQAVKRAQLQALSAELQPHFLFNTLNAIAGLVRSDSRTAETMLVRLSDLLRLTLGAAGAGESSLARELERLELYVALQRMRFGPRLTVAFAVPDELKGAAVPGLLLQPLVENALAHGIGPKEGPGTVIVRAARRGDRLVLSVSDDGVGLGSDSKLRERIGVGNTRARLAARFPGDHSFELGPGPAGGAVATIDIPLREAVPDARDHR